MKIKGVKFGVIQNGIKIPINCSSLYVVTDVDGNPIIDNANGYTLDNKEIKLIRVNVLEDTKYLKDNNIDLTKVQDYYFSDGTLEYEMTLKCTNNFGMNGSLKLSYVPLKGTITKITGGPEHTKWGSIIGVLSKQEDLQTELDKKADATYVDDKFNEEATARQEADTKLENNKLDKKTTIQELWIGTRTEYDAITVKSGTTIYYIEE